MSWNLLTNWKTNQRNKLKQNNLLTRIYCTEIPISVLKSLSKALQVWQEAARRRQCRGGEMMEVFLSAKRRWLHGLHTDHACCVDGALTWISLHSSLSHWELSNASKSTDRWACRHHHEQPQHSGQVSKHNKCIPKKHTRKCAKTIRQSKQQSEKQYDMHMLHILCM